MDRARVAFREVGLTEGATTSGRRSSAYLVIVDLHECLPGGLTSGLQRAARCACGRSGACEIPVVAAVGDDDGLGISRSAAPGPGIFEADPNRSPADLLEDVLKAEELRTRWLRVAVSGSTPRALDGDPAALQSEISTFARAVDGS